MTNGKWCAAGMLLFTTLAWGAMFAVAKSALGTLDAFWLSAWRYAPAALVMLVILWAVEGRGALLPDGGAIRLWLLGSLGFAGFSILGFLGIAQSRPEHAAIIVALMPLINALMGWLIRGRRPAAVTLAATLIALTGVLLVVTKGRWHAISDGTLHADALVLAGVVCWVAYTMGAASFPRLSALRYTAQTMSYGAATIVVCALMATAFGIAHAPAWRVVASLGGEVGYLSLVAGVLAVLAWNAGIAAIGPANGVLFINLVPITAFVIGALQGQRFGVAEIIGAALVIAALVVTNVANRDWRPRPLASRPKFA